jgi:hypothetical protein
VGSLELSNNPQLVSLEGLRRLARVAVDLLQIRNNSNLLTLDGLRG